MFEMTSKKKSWEFDDEFDNSREGRKNKFRKDRHRIRQLMKQVAEGKISPDELEELEELQIGE